MADNFTAKDGAQRVFSNSVKHKGGPNKLVPHHRDTWRDVLARRTERFHRDIEFEGAFDTKQEEDEEARNLLLHEYARRNATGDTGDAVAEPVVDLEDLVVGELKSSKRRQEKAAARDEFEVVERPRTENVRVLEESRAAEVEPHEEWEVLQDEFENARPVEVKPSYALVAGIL